MARYTVSVPVTITCTWTVEAEDEDAAREADPEFADNFYKDAHNGISVGRGCSISAPDNDSADWDQVDVTVDE